MKNKIMQFTAAPMIATSKTGFWEPGIMSTEAPMKKTADKIDPIIQLRWKWRPSISSSPFSAINSPSIHAKAAALRKYTSLN